LERPRKSDLRQQYSSHQGSWCVFRSSRLALSDPQQRP
jgi:hypothetical protein